MVRGEVMKKVNKTVKVSLVLLALICLVSVLWFNIWDPFGLDGNRRLVVAQIPAKIETLAEYGFPVRELNVSNVQLATEYFKISSSETSLGIARIAQDPSAKNIFAVDRIGKLRKWDVPSGKLVAEYDIFATDEHSTFFTENGSLLVSKGGAVWDSSNGKLLYCPPFDYTDCPTGFISEPDRSFYLDPLGRQFIYLFGRSLEWNSYFTPDSNGFQSGVGTSNGRLGCWDFVSDRIVFSPFSEAYFREDAAVIERIAIDPSGDYVACALSNGAIIVRNWNTAFDLFVNSEGINQTSEEPFVYFLRYKMSKGNVRDMVFDPKRTWLSVLTDKKLVTWDLRRWVFADHLNVSITDGNAIVFDRAGKLLVLGTERGLTVYDVELAKQIAEFEVGEVTAVYITRDNRLLIWGGADGTLHIWGIPEK